MTRVAVVFFAIVCTLCLVAVQVTEAQTPKPGETIAHVPALDAMHEVIMPMWHDAWPNKDYKALAAMLPDIQKHLAAIDKAELPGILREKQVLWVAGVIDLRTTVGAFKAAVDAGNNEALLKAAEKLHMQYEGLVKIVKPVLKEMEDFHATLYMMYHYQMSPFELAKATDSIQALKVKMDALNKATLPDKMKLKTEEFTAQRLRLSKSIDTLVGTLGSKDDKSIRQAIEAMHIEYEKLERVFG